MKSHALCQTRFVEFFCRDISLSFKAQWLPQMQGGGGLCLAGCHRHRAILWCAFWVAWVIRLSCLFLRGSNFFIFFFLYDRSLAILIVKIIIFNNLDYSVLLVFLMGQSADIFLKYLFRD